MCPPGCRVKDCVCLTPTPCAYNGYSVSPSTYLVATHPGDLDKCESSAACSCFSTQAVTMGWDWGLGEVKKPESDKTQTFIFLDKF